MSWSAHDESDEIKNHLESESESNFIGMSRIYRTLATISGRPLLSQSGYADSRRMLPRQLR